MDTGNPTIERAFEGADVAVQTRDDPGGGALEDREMPDLVHDLGHDLDRRRAGADDRDASTVQVVGMVPVGGVEHRAGELVGAGDGRQAGFGQRTGRRDQVAAPDLTVGGVDDPLLRATVPARRRQRTVVSDLIGEIDCDRA